MTDIKTNETTPDQLLGDFRGRSLKTIIVFTVVAHAVILLGSSLPFLWNSVAEEDTSELSEEERLETATREATAALREIAEKHNLKPQDLSKRFSDGAPKAPAPPQDPSATSENDSAEESDGPKSAIEEELKKSEPGPDLPSVEEDLFK